MAKPSRSSSKEFAGIEYHGLAGISKACKDAVIRLIQVGERITKARLLSCDGTHAFVLTVGVGDMIAVKSGFSSGYGGEGPAALSYVLGLLNAHDVEIEEYEVSEDVIERLDASALRQIDLDSLEEAFPRRGRWADYIYEKHWDRGDGGRLWCDFPLVIPFALLDSRLIGLAIGFWENPDAKIMTAYRRLEDTVRQRSGIDEHGARLFSQAFAGAAPKLCWDGADEALRGARAQLFSATYTAFRNRRAHQEPAAHAEAELREFLLVNELFLLEAATRPAPEKPKSQG